MAASQGPTGVHPIAISPSFFQPDDSIDADNESYHAFRFTFRPATIDTSSPSTISGSQRSEYTLSTPSNQPGHSNHIFKGSEIPAKDVDCLLIYDEDSQCYRLAKMGGTIKFDHQRGSGQVGSSPPKSQSSSTLPTSSSDRAESQVNPATMRSSRSPNSYTSPPPPQRARIPIVERPKSRSPPRKSRPIKSSRPAPPEPSTASIPAPAPSYIDHEAPSEDEEMEEKEEEEEEEAEDDEELDDLANMLESTLDESTNSGPGATKADDASLKRQQTFDREEESSEDED